MFLFCSSTVKRTEPWSFIRAETERMRTQIGRQRKDIQALRRVGVSTVSAEELLSRIQNKVDEPCEKRDELKGKESDQKRLPSVESQPRWTLKADFVKI